jgi:sirohydrochlorin ferrochelatase
MAAANDMLNEVVRMYQTATGAAIVEAAHMELAEPTLEDATARCVAQGATSIVVHPYFLAPGRHSTSDIPGMVAALAPRYPQIYFRVTEPLGVNAIMARLMHLRVVEALDRE